MLDWKNLYKADIFYKAETTSTMEDAKEYIKINRGIKNGTIFITDYQSQGKCRGFNKLWNCDREEGLLFTLVLERSFLEKQSGYISTNISLQAALAILRAICLYSGLCEEVDIVIKWPNDILINKKKASGILCESYKDSMLIGVGINVYQKVFSSDIATKATSLSIEGYDVLNRSELLYSILKEIDYVICQDNEWFDSYNKKLFTNNNKLISFQANSGNDVKDLVEGYIGGVCRDGSLIIKDTTGIQRVYYSGEILYDSFQNSK